MLTFKITCPFREKIHERPFYKKAKLQKCFLRLPNFKSWVAVVDQCSIRSLATYHSVSVLFKQNKNFFFFAVGGLLNATCGNVSELIIALFALKQHKIDVVKYSLLGSVLSNLLLVLGISLFTCGIFNLSKQQTFERVSFSLQIKPFQKYFFQQTKYFSLQ